MHRRHPSDQGRHRRASVCGAVIVFALAAFHAPLTAAISLSGISPLGATAGVVVSVTGLGFAPAAADNEVILTASGGTPVTIAGTGITVLNATTGLRRLTFVVPAAVPIGAAAVQVRNKTTNEVAGGRTLQIINLSLPQPVTAVRGTTGVVVTIIGSTNTEFVGGRTRAIVGSGVTVTSTQEVSPTELRLTVSIAATAPVGSRVITVTASTQAGLVPAGFQVVDVPPPNQQPNAAANGPYTGIEDAAIAFSSTGSSDPDNDSLQYAWSFGDGATSSEPNPQHAYATPGNYTATLVVSDGRGGSATATASVNVTPAIALLALDLTPPIITLRQLTATHAATLRGYFSDGSTRELTGDPDTTFATGDPAVATVDGEGLVTARAPGTTTLAASYRSMTATSDVRVIITEDAPGFLRGEVFDDTRSVPLGNVTATRLSGGGTAVGSSAIVDDRGRFTLTVPAGPAVVRITRPGFTSVDRSATAAPNDATTLLDARLTPFDVRSHPMQSVFGGEAASTDGSVTLSIPAGSLHADVTLRVTPISGQGLQGVLPPGWSPIAAADVQPPGRQFAIPATLRVPHIDTLASGADVVVARYDVAQQQWIVQPPGHVSDDRRTLSASVDSTGQFVWLVPDGQPASPPAGVPGNPLQGVTEGVIPDAATAAGEVVPRSAPPGDSARAMGTILLQPPATVASGVVLRARVSEEFTLLNNSVVLPVPFVQDVILYARPRLGDANSLAARLPITPTLQFSIQELSLGRVRLDIIREEAALTDAVVGTTGGSVTDAAGTILELPSGALPGDAPVGLLPLAATQLSAPIPNGFTLLSAVFLDAVGLTFAEPALLSISRPGGLVDTAQVLVAQVITDPAGNRRFRLVGIGQLTPLRIGIQRTLASLTFDGIRGGGEFAFLHAQQPVGFISGLVTSGGATALHALVTADTAPFAFVTGIGGTFIVAGALGATQVSAFDPAGAAAAGVVTLDGANAIAALNLGLAHAPPGVVAMTPARDAKNVPLDSSIVVDFSKPIDPSSITAASVVLKAGTTAVQAQAVVSANRRRITVTPSSALAGLTAYTLTLGPDIRDTAGNALSAFAPLTFTTLDPSKATALAVGAITAELPDEDGFSVIAGGPGVADAATIVAATNQRTQETSSVMSGTDGSFRLRLGVIIGDELVLTFRDANGRMTTISITQFSSSFGATAIGERGGTIAGPAGRVGRILPRALSTAGVFQLKESVAPLPPLPNGATAVDRLSLTVDEARFRQLASLALTDSQSRFAPVTAFAEPFTATAALAVPADFLISASAQFTATVADVDGHRRTAQGSTLIVAAAPDDVPVETAYVDQFPAVYLTAPEQATPSQVVTVSAIAPAARIDLDLPSSASALGANESLLLARVADVGGATRLVLVDTLTPVDVSGLTRLRTSGREWPGATSSGEYVVIRGPFAFISGRLAGPAVSVLVEGTPFTFDTGESNGAFIVAVTPGSPFALQFVDQKTHAILGTATGTAPAAGGHAQIASPLPPPAGQLTVSVDPGPQSIVDISTPIVFTFSEPLDRSSVSANAFLVTDDRGAQAFGALVLGDDGATVTFAPLRRWKYGTRYQVSVGSSVAALSGARLVQPLTTSFTTFAPRVLGSLPIAARDVVSAGGLALVATADGGTVVDLDATAAGAVVSTIPVAGGARAAALLTSALVDRNGLTVAAPVAVLAGGNPSTPGLVQTWSLATPSAPTLRGSSQVTTPPGQAAPPGVAAVAGTPNGLVTTAGTALVSVRDLGVQAVALGAAIPDNPAQPGAALSARFPLSGTVDVVQSALVGDRLIVASIDALTVLDVTTLAERATTPSLGRIGAVAALGGLRFDVNADGEFSTSEVLDLALAGDDAGVLGFYRVSADGESLELLSVVRMPSAASVRGISISPSEELAYIGVGARGIAIVDVRGPASVQPIDLDRNGVDDRILAMVDTPGVAGRLALDLSRGVAHVADGSVLTTLQVVPPRVRFLSLRRDPMLTHSEDEELLTENATAFIGDDAVVAAIAVAVPLGNPVSLVIEESSGGAGARALSFEGGSLIRPLPPGEQTVAAFIAPGASPRQLALIARDASGHRLASRSFALVDPPDDARFDSLVVHPASLVLDDETTTASVAAGGVLPGGRVLNITRDPLTTFASQDAHVVTVSPAAEVEARGGGRTTVTVSRQGLSASALVQVNRPATLVALTASTQITFIANGPHALGVLAQFSDGTRVNAADVPGTTFASSNPGVVSVDAAGRATAQVDGEATISVTHGTLSTSIRVAVELRSAASIQSIDLRSFPSPISADDGQVVATAQVSGTGDLHGYVVTFSQVGSVGVQAITNGEGLAAAALGGLTTPGQFTIEAAILDPQTGSVRRDAAQLEVRAGAGDQEPNGTSSAASRLVDAKPVTGALSPTDVNDVYRVDVPLASTVRLELTLAQPPPENVFALVVRDAAGVEISRTAITQSETTIALPVLPGDFFAAIESAGGSTSYSLTLRTEQGPVAISSVTPSSGSPGTTVIITGTGFSSRLTDVVVTFGRVEGKVMSATATRLDVVVPANAVDGVLGVSVANRSIEGPVFVVGNSGPLPRGVAAPSDPAKQRHDPVSGAVIDVSRLWVDFDPVTARSQVDQIVANQAGHVVGFQPIFNRYLVQFDALTTVDALRAKRALMAAIPTVRRVSPVVSPRRQADRSIDMQARSGSWANGGARSEPFELTKIFDALRAVRSTPPFDHPINLRKVRIAVIDSGFLPFVPEEFPFTVTVLGKTNQAGINAFEDVGLRETSGHGTGVSGIIAAANDGTSSSGVFSSLLLQDEIVFLPGAVELIVYACGKPGGLDGQCVDDALYDVIDRGNIDVVNMSFRSVDYESVVMEQACPFPGTTVSGGESVCRFYPYFRYALTRTLFVAAAGNDGIQAGNTFPAMLSTYLDNVITIGAVAVVNFDNSGEGADVRAQFFNSSRPLAEIHLAEVNCLGAGAETKPASNCGPGVSVAAPGEDYWTTSAGLGFGSVDYDYFNGTSSAAPFVAGLAAVLQSIRPAPTVIPPAELKRAIVDTADDVSATWRTATNEPMGRVNALAAVRRVLPSVTKQRIYITDQHEGSVIGHVTAVNVDPLNGELTGTSVEIPLQYTANGVTVTGQRPTAVVVSVAGEQALVLAATNLPGGDGLFTINTKSDLVDGFIPLSGETFPSTATVPILPIKTTLKSSMVGTRDGRLVFVSAGDRIVVVDVLSGRAVKNLDQLTWLANVARPIPSVYLFFRDSEFRQVVNSVQGQITSLSLSTDERTLYAVVHEGAGTEFQPGLVLEIDVSLDIDSNQNTPLVEVDLSNFFALKGQVIGHDEPSGVAVRPDSATGPVYVTNGGVLAFAAVIQDITGIFGAFSVFASNTFSVPLIDAVVTDLARRGSYTQLLAAGRVQAFEVGAGSLGGELWSFSSELSSGWTPTLPVVSDQFIRRRVNSERTFGMTFRFDGQRALVPFFQTGNFGVLDLDFQASLPVTAPAGVFKGLVAVTPSLKLDPFLWPPADEEPRLYPTSLSYAQNGRFAAAAHVGAGNGAGALTVLDDSFITDDLTVNVKRTVTNPESPILGDPVPYFAARPLCGARASEDDLDCLVDVFKTTTEYAVAGGSSSFTRPRGLAIQPFLAITRPQFGERVRKGNALMFEWRDGRATRYRFTIFDQGNVFFGTSLPGTVVVPQTSVTLTPQERNKQFVAQTLEHLFATGSAPQDNHRYRIEVRLETATGGLLGREIVEMVYRP
jgi:PKD repeat protein